MTEGINTPSAPTIGVSPVEPPSRHGQAVGCRARAPRARASARGRMIEDNYAGFSFVALFACTVPTGAAQAGRLEPLGQAFHGGNIVSGL
jgi:hypothetical protein